jgi:hypothetical protein
LSSDISGTIGNIAYAGIGLAGLALTLNFIDKTFNDQRYTGKKKRQNDIWNYDIYNMPGKKRKSKEPDLFEQKS